MNTKKDAGLSIVELEDRFETTVAALDSARCGDGATVKVEVKAV
jgi:hypothetical protein